MRALKSHNNHVKTLLRTPFQNLKQLRAEGLSNALVDPVGANGPMVWEQRSQVPQRLKLRQEGPT